MRQRSREKQNLYAVQNHAANIKYSARQHMLRNKKKECGKTNKSHKNDAENKKNGENS